MQQCYTGLCPMCCMLKVMLWTDSLRDCGLCDRFIKTRFFFSSSNNYAYFVLIMSLSNSPFIVHLFCVMQNKKLNLVFIYKLKF